jgi:tRNA pseudouridine55 synthase
MTKAEVGSPATKAGGPDGVLKLDKPAGPTSHDMVAAVRRALRTRRVGHTGTLDPFASGLLLICLGPATRVAEYLSGLDKRYTATVRLGTSTDTDDLRGAVLSESDASAVSRADVERVLATMRGEVLQMPPAYSAKKRDGERAYAAARAGRPLELEAVPVRIHDLRVTAWRLPELELEVHCGSGTYIRAIARDLGGALGVGGHLTALRRTAVGAHTVAGAVAPERLDDEGLVSAAMLDTVDALAHLPRLELDDAQYDDVRHGRAIAAGLPALSAAPGQDALHGDTGTVLLTRGRDLVAVAERGHDAIRPRKVFA